MEIVLRDGIWRCLTPEAAAEGERFLAGYRRLCDEEGWGSDDPDYYCELPFRDTTGRHGEIWRIRAASYRLLLSRVLTAGRLRVADLGAGNGWLSRRLAEAGHDVAAIDLSDDCRDGLGVADRLGECGYLRLQAAFDAVPLADGAIPISPSSTALSTTRATYRPTLAEALRLAGEGGRVAILDTPV